MRPADGALDYWSEEAARGDAVVVGGFAELDDDGLVYDSAAVVDGTGVLAIYRKAHLWLDEPRFFAVGQQPPPVIETRAGRIGVAICYDLFFPEVTRMLALAGAEIIAVPTNSPVIDEGVNADIGIAVARAAAHVNRVFIAVCDRCGTERGTAWAGRTVIIDPDGRVIGGPPGDRLAMVVADCELSVRVKRSCRERRTTSSATAAPSCTGSSTRPAAARGWPDAQRVGGSVRGRGQKISWGAATFASAIDRAHRPRRQLT